MLLGVLIALPALGTDLFVPALPVLAQALAVEVGAAQFTLTTYFIGLAAGMLLWGPLSDRYGRKPVLCAGLATMLAVSLAAAFVDSVGAVATARLVQGLAMSSGAAGKARSARGSFGISDEGTSSRTWWNAQRLNGAVRQLASVTCI